MSDSDHVDTVRRRGSLAEGITLTSAASSSSSPGHATGPSSAASSTQAILCKTLELLEATQLRLDASEARSRLATERVSAAKDFQVLSLQRQLQKRGRVQDAEESECGDEGEGDRVPKRARAEGTSATIRGASSSTGKYDKDAQNAQLKSAANGLLGTYHAQAADKDKVIAGHGKTVADLTERLQRLSADYVAASDNMLSDYRKQIAERNRFLAERDKRIAELQGRNDELGHRNEKLAEELHSLAIYCDGWEEETYALRGAIDELEVDHDNEVKDLLSKMGSVKREAAQAAKEAADRALEDREALTLAAKDLRCAHKKVDRLEKEAVAKGKAVDGRRDEVVALEREVHLADRAAASATAVCAQLRKELQRLQAKPSPDEKLKAEVESDVETEIGTDVETEDDWFDQDDDC